MLGHSLLGDSASGTALTSHFDEASTVMAVMLPFTGNMGCSAAQATAVTLTLAPCRLAAWAGQDCI